MATTVDQLINRCSRRLLGTVREEMNKLNGAINASVTSLTLTYPLGTLGKNGKLSIDDEILRVWDVNGQVVTVERGQDGSTAATHADGALVYCNPRFPHFDLLEMVKTEIASLGPRLFAVGTITIPSVSSSISDSYTSAYDLTGVTGEVYNVLDVASQPDGSGTVWPRVRKWRFRGKQDTALFPSGYALDILEPVTSGRLIQVVYAKPFDLSTFTSTTDVEATVGMRASMLDIPVLGVQWRLMSSRESVRTFGEAQGEPRNSAEVQGGMATAAARNLERLRDKRIRDEADALRRLYPLVGF